ncbi:hypothetical protein RDI58_023633 [Solanum bulbocastanum]|uniref:Uncharacterized protein n=1 Tax=Solanum bulbocastanum TaxID=147425 RepID=A0AAN8T481_SOLBU
MSLVSIDVT